MAAARNGNKLRMDYRKPRRRAICRGYLHPRARSLYTDNQYWQQPVSDKVAASSTQRVYPKTQPRLPNEILQKKTCESR